MEKSLLSDKAPVLTLADLTPIPSEDSAFSNGTTLQPLQLQNIQPIKLHSSLGELDHVKVFDQPVSKVYFVQKRINM